MEDIKSGRVIKGSKLDQTIISFIKNSWETKSDYFPGPQPISIERKHFPILHKGDHLVCEKTDGVRHLFVAMMVGEKKMSFLVNRSFEATLVPNVFAKHVYQGTILDGEYIDDTSREFLIYDATIVSGMNVMKKNLIERLTCAETVTKGVLRVSTQTLFKMKTFHHLNDQEFWKNIPFIKYKTDGLVFTPVSDPVMSGTHENMFKWKPLEKNTIDFLAKWDHRGSKWNLYVLEKGQLVFESEIPVHMVPHGFTITENAILECEYKTGDVPRWWKPVNIRTDKSHPNNRRTFYNTLTNIKENIQMNEFIMK
jgi:hypothetical protein